ncbi:STE3-domain-containing protein [Mycena sanguinolenta]|uniref:STE3-domain-containing protein n=1 Tax=Mycena sanguinolenta TaxID=230812 RepID=A0A8H6WRL8_9AGAR|nr:STE3-domain-containing protein [Mycena sanguinolenta]
MHPEFAPIAFLSAFSLALPLPWHWRAGNVATLSIMFWLFVTNIIYAIDALIWGNNVDIVATVWCDISTKLIVGSNIALPAACLCVCIHLESVASVRQARTSISDKRRRQLYELLACFVVPLVFMILHYIVQGHRFDIIEEYGCRPTTYFSIPSIFLMTVPPMLLSIASLVVGGLALRHFIVRRMSFAAHLDASHSALTTSRYLRLMLMAMLEMIWSLAVTTYTLWFTTIGIPLRPYSSWAEVHSNFSRIDTYPTIFIPDIVLRTYYFLWWLVPISTIAFVAMFAFGRDAMEEYKKCFLLIRRVIFRGPASGTPKKSFDKKGAMELPSYESSPGAATAPASPGALKHAEAAYDRQSVASFSVGPALSYHAHPVDESLDFDSDFYSETCSSYAPTTPSPLARAPIPPPGDLAFAPPRSRNLTGDAPRPYTYPSLDASHHAISSAV